MDIRQEGAVSFFSIWYFKGIVFEILGNVLIVTALGEKIAITLMSVSYIRNCDNLIRLALKSGSNWTQYMKSCT